jgi:hypothetical protein
MRDNYYILLELDPVVIDEVIINKAISEKQQEWSVNRNHPTKSMDSMQKLQNLPQIKAVMLNPELREKEAEEAKKILVDKEQEKNIDFLTSASILVKNGEITENDLKALLKKSKFKYFTEEKALKILKARIKKQEITYNEDGIQLLDESVIKKIRTDLKFVSKKDLFDFLSLSPTSSCTLLVQKANEIYNSSSRNAGKTVENVASISLAQTCTIYLKDETSKKRYLKSLEFELFQDMNELIDIAGFDKIIDIDEYQKIIFAFTNKGISTSKAISYIQHYCKKKSYILIETGTNIFDSKKQCRICYCLNEKWANFCNQCGASFDKIG